MNIVILHGRLTADPTLRQSASGKSIAGFTVAVDGYKDSSGNKQTDFIRCTAFGQTADLMSRFFTKGKEIALEGSLHPNDYTDNNGVKHFSYQVNVNRVHFCGSKNENGGQQQQQGYNPSMSPYQNQLVNQYAQQQNNAPRAATPAQQSVNIGDIGEFEEILSGGEIPF